MEKKNTGLIVLVVILILLVLGLGGYIVYDKFLDKPVVDEVSENTDAISNDEELIDFVSLVGDLKSNFDVIYGVYSSPNTYCGKGGQTSDKTSPNGGKYEMSTQFNTYDELYAYLNEYATTDVLSIMSKMNKEFYLEEDGKLYCANLGKGGAYEYDDTVLEYVEFTDNTLDTIVYKTMHAGNSKEIEKFNVTFTKNEGKWIISKFELVK